MSGERRRLGGWFPTLTLDASRTHYQHQEVEGGGEVGTTFSSRGQELRLQAQHRPLALAGGTLAGVLGLQAESLDFSALGEEAFVPGTHTRSSALFVVEELKRGALTWSAGLRRERVRVGSDGDPADAPEPRFGAAVTRRFEPTSVSLGLSGEAAGAWQWSAAVGHTERAPAYYELYADGVHVATAAYERGDPTLGLERSRHAELGLGWKTAALQFKASLFETRFARYIALEATGSDVVIDEGGTTVTFPEYAFRGVRARLRGVELDAQWRPAGAPLALALSGGLDLVRGDQLDSGEPLPRLAPLRLRAAVEAGAGAWRAGLGLRHAAAQSRVPSTDRATPGHTRLDLWAQWQSRWSGADALWFVRLDNLTDELAYNASTLATLRDLVPLPGRALSAGFRLRF